MKTKGNKSYKVNVVTLGCAKNLVDSEVMVAQLQGGGINAVHEQAGDHSNVVIINTCGFIESAKQESIDTILRYAEAKENRLIEKLYVTGCLSERYKEELQKEIQQVDAYFGTRDLPALLKRFKVNYKHELVGERTLATSSHFAYLKISEGCDRPCSFCAIPLMRGNHISRTMEEVVEEARLLASRGVREIMIIAQDSTYYGIDLYGTRKLAELLDRISDVDGIEWVRLHYAFPSGFPMDVLDIMAAKPNICKYLDIPLQHASTNMLKVMRRGTTREKTEELLSKIRYKIPGIAIRTTMMVGHPGETRQDFSELLDFIERNRFERLGVFTYSHEEDTHSYTMDDIVSRTEKKKRANKLMAVQEEISFDMNLKKVGKTFKVLVDRKEGDYFIGRTEYDSPEVDNEVLIPAEKNYLRIGDFANIRIVEAMPFDLIGQPIIE